MIFELIFPEKHAKTIAFSKFSTKRLFLDQITTVSNPCTIGFWLAISQGNLPLFEQVLAFMHLSVANFQSMCDYDSVNNGLGQKDGAQEYHYF